MKWREYIRVLLVQGIYLRRIYFSLPWVVINLGWNDPFLSLPKRTLGLLPGIFSVDACRVQIDGAVAAPIPRQPHRAAPRLGTPILLLTESHRGDRRRLPWHVFWQAARVKHYCKQVELCLLWALHSQRT